MGSSPGRVTVEDVSSDTEDMREDEFAGKEEKTGDLEGFSLSLRLSLIELSFNYRYVYHWLQVRR